MNLNAFYTDLNEKPLDRLPEDGGFCGIFRTIGCIGDSLSSGEFESMDGNGLKGYHDMYEYSWGQYMARMVGAKVYNFSCGGMSARGFWNEFGNKCGCFDVQNACQAYILALGVNDAHSIELGSLSDLNEQNFYAPNQPETFANYYGKILLKLRQMQPKSRIFLMSMPRTDDPVHNEQAERHAALLHDFAAHFPFMYVIDFTKYAPVYDEAFRKQFNLGGHLNPMGYMLTAKMTAAYIDYIIRHNAEDFAQVGFIGKPYYNCAAKW